MQQFFFVKPSLSYVKIQHSMVKIQLQNPNQTSVSKSWPKLKMLTNLLPQNFDLSSASKSWANFSFNIVTKKGSKSWPNLSLKVLTKNKLQNIDLTSASISWPKTKFKISTKPQLQNLNETVVKIFLSINISSTNNIKKFWVDIFKWQGKPMMIGPGSHKK